jgi:hypothetical protein
MGREGLEPDENDTRLLEEATPPVDYHDGDEDEYEFELYKDEVRLLEEATQPAARQDRSAHIALCWWLLFSHGPTATLLRRRRHSCHLLTTARAPLLPAAMHPGPASSPPAWMLAEVLSGCCHGSRLSSS